MQAGHHKGNGTTAMDQNAIDPITAPYDIARILGGLYGDGFIALKGAFSREWV